MCNFYSAWYVSVDREAVARRLRSRRVSFDPSEDGRPITCETCFVILQPKAKVEGVVYSKKEKPSKGDKLRWFDRQRFLKVSRIFWFVRDQICRIHWQEDKKKGGHRGMKNEEGYDESKCFNWGFHLMRCWGHPSICRSSVWDNLSTNKRQDNLGSFPSWLEAMKDAVKVVRSAWWGCHGVEIMFSTSSTSVVEFFLFLYHDSVLTGADEPTGINLWLKCGSGGYSMQI